MSNTNINVDPDLNKKGDLDVRGALLNRLFLGLAEPVQESVKEPIQETTDEANALNMTMGILRDRICNGAFARLNPNYKRNFKQWATEMARLDFDPRRIASFIASEAKKFAEHVNRLPTTTKAFQAGGMEFVSDILKPQVVREASTLSSDEEKVVEQKKPSLKPKKVVLKVEEPPPKRKKTDPKSEEVVPKIKPKVVEAKKEALKSKLIRTPIVPKVEDAEMITPVSKTPVSKTPVSRAKISSSKKKLPGHNFCRACKLPFKPDHAKHNICNKEECRAVACTLCDEDRVLFRNYGKCRACHKGT